MNKENVLLIAVGGIGFRHFQALINCQSDFVLYVVDVSREALEQARRDGVVTIAPYQKLNRLYASGLQLLRHHRLYADQFLKN